MHKKGRLTFGYYFELKPSFRNVQRWVKSFINDYIEYQTPMANRS